MGASKAMARGLRNNNPLNIEYNKNNNWRGQVGNDGRFVIFDSQANGYRAGSIILLNYQKRGLLTIEQMINQWAPPHENPTSAYVDMVARRAGVAKDQKLSLKTNPAVLAGMLDAMTRMETGSSADMVAVNSGIGSAGVA